MLGHDECSSQVAKDGKSQAAQMAQRKHGGGRRRRWCLWTKRLTSRGCEGHGIRGERALASLVFPAPAHAHAPAHAYAHHPPACGRRRALYLIIRSSLLPFCIAPAFVTVVTCATYLLFQYHHRPRLTHPPHALRSPVGVYIHAELQQL